MVFLLNLLFHIISVLSIAYIAFDSFYSLFQAGERDRDKLGIILSIILGKILYIVITVATYCNPNDFYQYFLTSENNITTVNWLIWFFLVAFGFTSCFFYSKFLNVHNIVVRRLLVSFITVVMLFLGHSYITSFTLNYQSDININLGLLPFLGITTGVLIYTLFFITPLDIN